MDRIHVHRPSDEAVVLDSFGCALLMLCSFCSFPRQYNRLFLLAIDIEWCHIESMHAKQHQTINLLRQNLCKRHCLAVLCSRIRTHSQFMFLDISFMHRLVLRFRLAFKYNMFLQSVIFAWIMIELIGLCSNFGSHNIGRCLTEWNSGQKTAWADNSLHSLSFAHTKRKAKRVYIHFSVNWSLELVFCPSLTLHSSALV